MATILTNQATLNYRYGTVAATAVSNVASTVLNSPLGISKSSISECYRLGQTLTYVITVENNNSNAAEDITVTDDLGTYEANGNEVTPLTYVGPAQLFINGIFQSVITPTVQDRSIVFEIESIPQNGNAQIIYLAQVNSYANGAVGSEITNTATADTDCGCPCDEPVSDSLTVTACEYAEVRIVKSICPNPATCGERLTYTINLYNYGNMPATDVVLTDTFDPALADIEVSVNGTIVPAEDYDYINGTLTLPAEDSDYEITVPAATFTQNPTTGLVTVTPGTAQIVVSGVL